MHLSSRRIKGTECPQSLSRAGGKLLRFLHRPTVREFQPKSADAFWTRARVPAKTIAQELVLSFAFQAEAERLFVE
jgi:hypothetical protein